MPPPPSPIFHLYIDETGSRHPDRAPTNAKHGLDWFALGGFLIKAEDVDPAKNALDTFIASWPQIRAPLHLTDMRAERKAFAWLGTLSDDERTRFWTEYRRFLCSVPIAATACVIDRPGYVARGYGSRQGDAKWLLCRSAFDILVDRSAKYAKHHGRRLRIFYERADPNADRRTESYYKYLKTIGLAFDSGTSSKYQPLSQSDFMATLLSIEGKDKQNKMLQIADTLAYAISRGSYQRKFEIYRRLAESGMLVTSQVPGNLASTLGIKTYCFP